MGGQELKLFVNRQNAARLLDMKPSQFSDLVQIGVLPNPRCLGKYERWDVEELQAILRGDQFDEFENVNW